MALVKNVSGRSLRNMAETKYPKCTLRKIMSKVREILPLIHEEWGFFGGIGVDSIYYDSVAKKITFTDWHRNNLAFKHYPDDYQSGVVWPYNLMMKNCEDKMYKCCDKLAIFCTFAYSLRIKY